MPALIESFASLRVPAWHGLGTVFEEPVSTDEMLTLASMSGWDVRLVPVLTESRGGPTLFEVVRTNPIDQETDRLGFVGERYTVVQNEEIFHFLDNITDGGQWETAGSLRDGAVVFGSQTLDRSFVLDPSGAADQVDAYFLASSAHDGSMAVQISNTAVRVVCANTLNIALRGAKQTYKIRHTQSVDGKVAAAKSAVGIAHTYFDAFEEEARALFEIDIVNSQFEEMVKALYPEPEVSEVKGEKAARTRWENKFERVLQVYSGPTNKTIAGTAWGAFNALLDDNQWNRNVRAGNVENALSAGAGFDMATNQFRAKALQVVKAFA
jgi:phage/plasmid-like protein (TIGR03299 family)